MSEPDPELTLLIRTAPDSEWTGREYTEIVSIPVGTPPSDSVVQLVRADMERATDQMRRLLAVEMYKSNPLLDNLKARLPVPTWRQKLRWKLARLTTYWVTIGRALRGDELVDPADNDW